MPNPCRHRQPARPPRGTVHVAVALAAFAVAMPASGQPQGKPVAENPPVSSTTASKFGANVTELKIIDQKQGTGAEAVAGKTVIVHYTGWLYDPATPDGHGKKFDSSVDRGVP